MFSMTEQFTAAKSQLESQLSTLNTMAATAFEGAQQVIALNLHTTKATVEQGSAAARDLLEARDPQQFFAMSTARIPNFDGLFAYGRELFTIASKTQAELLQSAQQQFKDAGKQLRAAPVLAAPVVKAAKVEAKVETKAEARPEVAAEVKADAKPAKARAEAKPEAKAEPAAAPEAESKPEVKAAKEGKAAKAAVSFPDPKTAGGKQIDMLAGAGKPRK